MVAFRRGRGFTSAHVLPALILATLALNLVLFTCVSHGSPEREFKRRAVGFGSPHVRSARLGQNAEDAAGLDGAAFLGEAPTEDAAEPDAMHFVEIYRSGEEAIEFHGTLTLKAQPSASSAAAASAAGSGSGSAAGPGSSEVPEGGGSLQRSLVRVKRGDGREGRVVSSEDNYAGVAGQALVKVSYGGSHPDEALLVVSDRGVYEGTLVSEQTPRAPLPEMLLALASGTRDGSHTSARSWLSNAPSSSAPALSTAVGENGGVCSKTGTCLPSRVCSSQGGTPTSSSSSSSDGCSSASSVCCDIPRNELFRRSRVDGFAKSRLYWRDPQAWRAESRKQQRVLGSVTARRIPGAALAVPGTIALPRGVDAGRTSSWEECERRCDADGTCGAWSHIPAGVRQRYAWGGVSGNTLIISGNALDLGLSPRYGSGLSHNAARGAPSATGKCFLHPELRVRDDSDVQYAVLPCRVCESGVKDWAVHDNYGQLREVFFSMRELLQFYRAEMLGVVAGAAEDVSLAAIGTLIGADGAGVVAGTEVRLQGAIDAVSARTTLMATTLSEMTAKTQAGRRALTQQVDTLKAMARALSENASKSAEWLAFLISRASAVDWNAGEAAELFAKSLASELRKGVRAGAVGGQHGAAAAARAAVDTALGGIEALDKAPADPRAAADALWSLRTAILAAGSAPRTPLPAAPGATSARAAALLTRAASGRLSSHLGSAIDTSTAEVAWAARTVGILAGAPPASSSSSSSSSSLSLEALAGSDTLEKVTDLWRKLGPKLAAVVGGDGQSVDMDGLVEAVRRIGALARGDMSVKEALDAYDPKALLDFAAAAVSEATGLPADDLVFYAERAEIFHAMYKETRASGDPPKLADVWSASRPLIAKLLDGDGDGSVQIGKGDGAVALRLSDVDWAVRSLAQLRELRGREANDKLEVVGDILGDVEGPVARILEQHGLQAGDAKFVLDRVIDLRERDYSGAASALIERTRPVINGFLEERTDGHVTADDLLWAVDTIQLLRDGDKGGVRKALLGKAEEKFDPILGQHGLVWADLASIVDTLRSDGGTSLGSIAGILADDSNSAVAKVHGLANEVLEGSGADANDLVFALQQIAKIRETGDYRGAALALVDHVEPRIDALLSDRGVPIKVSDVKWAVETYKMVRETGDRRAGLESALERFSPQIDQLMQSHGLDADGKLGSRQVTWAIGVALDVAEGKTSGKDLSRLLREAHTELGPVLEGRLPGGVTLDDVAWAVDTYKEIRSSDTGEQRGTAVNAAVDQAIDRFSAQIDGALKGTGFNAESVTWAVTAVRDARAGRYGDAAESALLAAEGKIRAALADRGSKVTFEDLQWGLETVRNLPQIAADLRANPEDTAIALLTELPEVLKGKLSGLGTPVEDIVWGLQAVKTVRAGEYGDAAQLVIDRFGPRYEAALARHGLTVDDVRFVAATSFALVQKDTTANEAIRDTILRFGPRAGRAVFNTDVDWAVRSVERLVAGDRATAADEAIGGLVNLGVERFSSRLITQLEGKVSALAEAAEGRELSARDRAWSGVLSSLKDEKFRKLLADTTVKGIQYARGQRGKENVRADLDEFVFGAAGFFDQYFGFNTLGGQAHEELMKKRHDRVIPPVDTHVAGIMFESTRTFLESKLDLMVKQLADKPGWQFHAEVAFDKKQLRAIAGTQFANGDGELLFDFSVTDPFGDAPVVSAKARVNYEKGNFNMGGEVLVEQVGAFRGEGGGRSSRIAVQGFVTYTSDNTMAGIFFDAQVPLEGANAAVADPSAAGGSHAVITVRSFVYHSVADGRLNVQFDAGAQFIPNRQLLAEARFGLHYRLTDSLTVSAIGEMSYNRALGSNTDLSGLHSSGITHDLFQDTGRPGGFATNREGFNGFVGGEIRYQPRGSNWEVGVYGGARSYNGQRPSGEVGINIKFKF